MLIAGTLFVCKHPLCYRYLAARYKLEARRKNNHLSLLHNINTGHVDFTIDQYIQRSEAFSTCKGRPPSPLPFIFYCNT